MNQWDSSTQTCVNKATNLLNYLYEIIYLQFKYKYICIPHIYSQLLFTINEHYSNLDCDAFEIVLFFRLVIYEP